MVSLLSLPPIVPADLSAITPLVDRSTTSAAEVSSAAVAASTSSFVRISPFGRFLAATAATDAPILTVTAAGQNASVVAVASQGSAPNEDTLAAEQGASAASFILQSIVNDPALRAIANNLFNPAYSALLAAAHQADFTTPQPLARAHAVSIDIPAPVQSIAQIDGINNYNQTAEQFANRQPRATFTTSA